MIGGREHRLDQLNRKNRPNCLVIKRLRLIKGASRFGPVFLVRPGIGSHLILFISHFYTAIVLAAGIYAFKPASHPLVVFANLAFMLEVAACSAR